MRPSRRPARGKASSHCSAARRLSSVDRSERSAVNGVHCRMGCDERRWPGPSNLTPPKSQSLPNSMGDPRPQLARQACRMSNPWGSPGRLGLIFRNPATLLGSPAAGHVPFYGRFKHNAYPATPASRAHEAGLKARQREARPARAHQRIEVELPPINALPDALHAVARAIGAAHVHPPAEASGDA